ncbi:MAG: BON domain-containing protein [Planctomycetaceae bacterium]|nr:BON domain-containing protein [Planctomycetaceae bacterium]
MRCLSSLLVFFTVFHVTSTASAQWWGSESLPGNPEHYTYKTRFGNWQFGALERNISTPRQYSDRGIIRNWNDGTIIAVDRNVPGNRFAQQGTPNLVYVPQIRYFDTNNLTDTQFRNGLRQYWPEDQQLLNHEWEQMTYEPARLPVNTAAVSASSVVTSVAREAVVVPQQESQNRVSMVVVQQVPAKTVPPKPTYHQRVMQGHAERRAAEEERNRLYVQRLAEQNRQQDEWQRRSLETAEPVDPLWFRDRIPTERFQSQTAVGKQLGYGMSAVTYTIPTNPVAEQEKRLEYALAGSPEIAFYSPFQARFENGTVTVTGIVGSEEQRLAAERVLLAQPHVRHVQNNLTVAE